MAEEGNIYQAPRADLSPPPATGGGFSPRMIELVRKTRPWISLVAIFGLVATGLIVLIGAVMSVAMVVTQGDLQFLGLGLIYLFLAVIYFFPFYFLQKYARALKSFAASGAASDMEDALARQYSFWRLIGILTLVVLVIYALIFIGGIGMAILAGMRG